MQNPLIFIFFFFLSPRLWALDFPKDIVLGLGEQRCLKIDKPGREKLQISVGNSQVIGFKDHGNCLMIKGKVLGFTDLILFEGTTKHQIQVYVITRSIAAWVGELQEVLGKKSHFTLKPLSQGIWVRGEVLSYSEAKILYLSQRILKDKLILDVKISPELLKISEKLIKERFPYFKTKVLEEGLVVEAFHSNEKEKEFFTEILQSIFPLVRIFFSEQRGLSPQAKLVLKLIELKENFGDSTGFNWNKTINQFVSYSPGGANFNVGFESALSFLSSQGKISIIAHSSIIIKEGEQAKVFSGGEIPIVSTTKKETTVDWKSYGLSMDVKFIGVNQDILKFSISTEQSDIDTSNSHEGIPGIAKSNLNTVVQTKDRHPLVLTGLTKLLKGESEEGVFGLSQIPFLGRLFKTVHKMQRKSLLIFAIEPEIDYAITPGV